MRKSMELWVGCVAGALHENDYKAFLTDAGFESIDVEPWRVYAVEDARQFLTDSGLDVNTLASEVDGKVASAFIRATKPQPAAQPGQDCCGSDCCA